jgi:hypothetical protein
MQTAMARSSGLLNTRTLREKFTSSTKASGNVQYRVFPVDDGVAFSFVDGELTGQRKLDYFIGSGAVGRSYLSSINGFLFQAPVSWYSRAERWDISPGFEKTPEVNLLRGVEPACLRCHASRVRWIEGTANQYRTPAFLENGISCEKCHGPGEEHVLRMKSGKDNRDTAIVNPVKLDPDRRNSICAQCHLSGAVEIARGDGPTAFRPGQLLADKAVTFVWSSTDGAMPVISHFERMSQSKCLQGAKLWCGTCHDPHSEPAETAKAAWYRGKCLTCHQQSSCTAAAAARSRLADNCVGCHMPRSVPLTVQHAVFTDHSIPRRRVGTQAAAVPQNAVLLPFGSTKATERELGFAYADVAIRENNRAWGMRAFQLLQTEYAGDPSDAKVAAQLAQLYDRMGQEKRACEMYAQVVAANPIVIAPAINLGTCRAKDGKMEEAMALWSGVIQRSPGQEGARLNLAVAQIQTGNRAAARATLAEALKFNPASRKARELFGATSATVLP